MGKQMRSLAKEDFAKFLQLWNEVSSYRLRQSPDQDSGTQDDLALDAIWKFATSLEIAANLKEAETESVLAFRHVLDALRGHRFVLGFENEVAWITALRVARTYLRRNGQTSYSVNAFTREGAVARSLQRLSTRGLLFHIDGTGVNLAPTSFDRCCVDLDVLIAKLGGYNVIRQVFLVLARSDRTYLGYFLSGRYTSALPRHQEPGIPWHFIYNLALKHLRDHSYFTGNAQSAWTEILELAQDIAAVLDVERYSIWEDSHFSASGLNQAVIDNVVYDELFAFPQWGGDIAG